MIVCHRSPVPSDRINCSSSHLPSLLTVLQSQPSCCSSHVLGPLSTELCLLHLKHPTSCQPLCLLPGCPRLSLSAHREAFPDPTPPCPSPAASAHSCPLSPLPCFMVCSPQLPPPSDKPLGHRFLSLYPNLLLVTAL